MSDRTPNLKRTRNARPTTKAMAAFDATALNLAIIALAASFLVGYLVMNGRASSAGYAIRAAERSIAELETERKRLDAGLMAAQSLQRVEEGISGLGMVQVTNVEYVNIAPPSVAVR